MADDSSHVFVPDDEGLFCLFCGRTASEHRTKHNSMFAGIAAQAQNVVYDEDVDEALEDEDDFEAIQEELRKLTRECRREREGRMKAETLLNEMKHAHEKLRDDVGQISTWGSNGEGQLGHATSDTALVEIRGLLRQVSCGGAHTCALTDDGQLYIWGRGAEGQLGLGDLRPRAVPTLLKKFGDKARGTTVLQVSCGGSHTIALCDNGEVYAWGANDEMQLGVGLSHGKKVNRPELLSDLAGKGVLRVAAGKNFSLALTEGGDVYSWGSGTQMQLGHGARTSEEFPRLVETVREARRLGVGSAAEHSAAVITEVEEGEEEAEEEEAEDALAEVESSLERSKGRREDAISAAAANRDALALQLHKVEAQLAAGVPDADEGLLSRLSNLKEALVAEMAELEVLLTGKQQLEETMEQLGKQRQSQFKAATLMKWSRPGVAGTSAAAFGGAAASAAGGAAAGRALVGGGYTARTAAKMRVELQELQAARRALLEDLRDVDEQLDQIEIERGRLAGPSDEDPDISEALEELREQLHESKKDKFNELQQLEREASALALELGVSAFVEEEGGGAPVAAGDASTSAGASADLSAASAGSIGLDSATLRFLKTAAALWRKLEQSAIEKINVGQAEGLGIKDLLKLSNEKIDVVIADLHRAAGPKPKGDADEGEPLPLVYHMLLDNSNCRKRLNDYTEGLLVQVSQKMDTFKQAYEASKAGQAEGSRTARRL